MDLDSPPEYYDVHLVFHAQLSMQLELIAYSRVRGYGHA